MIKKAIQFAMVFCLALTATAFAADPNVGTWKLNESKSKITPGSPQNTSVIYTVEGDKYKCVVEGVDGAGKPTRNVWVGKFDGKDYAVEGDPTADTRAIKKVSESRYLLNNKKGGKKTTTGNIVFSADGKTRTLTMKSKDAAGKKFTNVAVYERQ